MRNTVDISVLVPTCRRPDLLERCLGSILAAVPENQERFEVVVGDDSSDVEVNRRILADFSSRWRGAYSYTLHKPSLGQQGNFNALLQISSGRFVQFVHDDDYLLEGAGQAFLGAVNRHHESPAPIKFGVWLVSQDGRRKRIEAPSRRRHLTTHEAVKLMISESSYVRFPSMFVPRTTYQAMGFFDSACGYIADLALWLKMAKSHGLIEVPTCTAAYTVHEAAGTSTMFTPAFIGNLYSLLNGYADFATHNGGQANRLIGKFMWRFVLAGQLRAFRARNWTALQERVDLAHCPEMRQSPCPPRWLGLRSGLKLARHIAALTERAKS